MGPDIGRSEREAVPVGAFAPNFGAGSLAGDEERLLQALRRGDEAAYEELVRAHGGRMLAVTRRLLRSEDDARDAVQDALISAFKGIGRFESGCRLSTWLHRIAVNAALMKIRSRKRVAEESIEAMLPQFRADGHPVEWQPVAWEPGADDEVERDQRAALVRRCISELPDSYRTVIMLREFEEMDTAETAAALGINENTVKIRLHRARQALRTLLDPHLRSGELRA
jgi:RNA polymerase sigma-70 factor (ECF subfamily)